jgi:hypothetical protein
MKKMQLQQLPIKQFYQVSSNSCSCQSCPSNNFIRFHLTVAVAVHHDAGDDVGDFLEQAGRFRQVERFTKFQLF